MPNALKYMIDEKGNKTSVLVPLKTWEKINQEYSKLQKKGLYCIKAGLNEIKEARKNLMKGRRCGQNLQTSTFYRHCASAMRLAVH